jgi:preprotein translocase subunit SecY
MKKFWNTVITIFKTEDIRRKILFSFSIMVVFRILASIPVVGIPTECYCTAVFRK